jgi:hypothetical protein
VRLLLLLLALVLAVPAAAAADPYPGQAPVTDPMSLQAIQVATHFWRVRGLTGCPDRVQAYMADSLVDGDGVDAAGRGGDCQAWLAREPLLELFATDDPLTALATECEWWTHEVGHALGLPHSSGGVMDPLAPVMPFDCVAWARHLCSGGATPVTTSYGLCGRSSRPLRMRASTRRAPGRRDVSRRDGLNAFRADRNAIERAGLAADPAVEYL